ncbi:hypothetical protein [Vibrio metschnikovii]|uniref:Uncharacterized protein n=1 Tax=Vibrio metschnikovii TaxID=28172 RepID=A0A9X0UKQ2_VIBME|nr:hypothetical protein [Vibrio metschnikovii]MBC5853264.1 hypothetical protein [Vibrio metschnikovii]
MITKPKTTLTGGYFLDEVSRIKYKISPMASNFEYLIEFIDDDMISISTRNKMHQDGKYQYLNTFKPETFMNTSDIRKDLEDSVNSQRDACALTYAINCLINNSECKEQILINQ